LSAGGAQIEAETGLSQDADLRAAQIIERLEEVLVLQCTGSNQDGIDLPGPG
jgi:hypothetical protein